MSSCEKSPSFSGRSPTSLMCSVTCPCCRLVIVVERSHLGSCTLDYGTAVGNPNSGQRVADDHARVPRKRLLVFLLHSLHVYKTREVVQRALRPCSVSLRGAGLVSSDVCGPRLFLRGGQGVSLSSIVLVPVLLSAAGSLRLGLFLHIPKRHLIPAEDTLVRAVSAVVIFGRSDLVHGIAVLFKIRPRLCFGAVLCCLVVVFLPNPYLHVLSYHSSTVPPGESLPVVFSITFDFRDISQSTSFAADRRQGCGAFRMIATTCFCMRSSRCPRRRITRCKPVLQHTMFMAGKVCFSNVF